MRKAKITACGHTSVLTLLRVTGNGRVGEPARKESIMKSLVTAQMSNKVKGDSVWARQRAFGFKKA